MNLREIIRHVWLWINPPSYTSEELAMVVASDIRVAIVKVLAKDNDIQGEKVNG